MGLFGFGKKKENEKVDNKKIENVKPGKYGDGNTTNPQEAEPYLLPLGKVSLGKKPMISIRSLLVPVQYAVCLRKC